MSDPKKIIIPKGLINPNETTVVEIPVELQDEPNLVASPKPQKMPGQKKCPAGGSCSRSGNTSDEENMTFAPPLCSTTDESDSSGCKKTCPKNAAYMRPRPHSSPSPRRGDTYTMSSYGSSANRSTRQIGLNSTYTIPGSPSPRRVDINNTTYSIPSGGGRSPRRADNTYTLSPASRPSGRLDNTYTISPGGRSPGRQGGLNATYTIPDPGMNGYLMSPGLLSADYFDATNPSSQSTCSRCCSRSTASGGK